MCSMFISFTPKEYISIDRGSKCGLLSVVMTLLKPLDSVAYFTVFCRQEFLYTKAVQQLTE